MAARPAPHPSVPSFDLTAFFAQQHRLPRLGDPQPPWRYRGFLLPYVIGIHDKHPAGWHVGCRG